MKTFLLILSFMAALLGTSVMAYALDYTADLSLTLSEQYNDNIFLDHSNKVSDYITSISPAIALSTRTEKFDALANYSPTFNEYANNSGNNNFSHQASILGHYKITQLLTFGLTDTFVQSRDASVIRTVEGAGPISRGIEKITTNTVGGDLEYKLTGRITLLGNAVYTYTDTQTGTEDVSSYGGGLEARYLFNEKTTFRLSATYTLFDYRVSGNATNSSYTAGINYKFTPTITADAYGGVLITEIDQPKTTVTGFAGGLSITKIFERGSAILSYVQSVIAGVESPVPVESKTITFRYTAPVTTKLDAAISAFYSRFRSVGNSGNIGLNEDRNDMGGTANLSYRLLPWLSGILSYTYVNSDDKATKSASYNNNIIMASLRLSKQARF